MYLPEENNKGAHQTARMGRLVCAFVRMQQNSGFLARNNGPALEIGSYCACVKPYFFTYMLTYPFGLEI